MILLFTTGYGWPVIIDIPSWWLAAFGSFSLALVVSGMVLRAGWMISCGAVLALESFTASIVLDVIAGRPWLAWVNVGCAVLFCFGLFWVRYFRRQLPPPPPLQETKAFERTGVD